MPKAYNFSFTTGSLYLTESIDILVFIKRKKDGSRKIEQVTELTGMKGEDFILKEIS